MSTEMLRKIAIGAIERFSPSIDELPDNRDCTAFFFNYIGETVFKISCDDAYIALGIISLEPFPSDATGIGLVSPGWMSPSTADAPSAHSDRQRVEIATVLNLTFDSASAVWLAHDREFVDCDGDASGPLLEALGHALFSSIAMGVSEDH